MALKQLPDGGGSELFAALIMGMKKSSTSVPDTSSVPPGSDKDSGSGDGGLGSAAADFNTTPCSTTEVGVVKTWWPQQWQMEEIVMYFLLLMLLCFLFVQINRCVRTTLDPYNTLAREAWYETFNKARVQTFV